MRVVIQRVNSASVSIENEVFSSIDVGLLIFVGFDVEDDLTNLDWVCSKIVNMRIFSDSEGKMNLSVKDVCGDILAVSQFTLHASIHKGNRPSFIRSAPATVSEPMYEAFVKRLSELFGKPVATGVFGANMKIKLINDGPVTILIDN